MNNSPLSRVRSVISITCVVVLVCVITSPTLSAQSLPSPWVTGDVGIPAGQGAAVFSNDTFRVNAAAGDIGSQGDQFTFVQRKLTGDGVIVARVRAAQNGDALSKAGVMIRESLDPQSTYVFALATGSGAVRFQRRRTEGGPSVRTNAGTGAAPWVKIERRGATFTAFRSADGVTWREIGTDIVPMADTVFVGLAVTAGAAPAAATADFSTVSVSETAAPLAAAAPPPGWASADVGLPLLAGSEQENAGVLTLTGGGVDAGGVSDQFHYLYQQVSGDVNIITRVTAVQLVDAASKGGVMIRDSLTSNGAHASMFMTAGNGPAFVRRAAAGGLATSTSTGTMAAPLWLKLELRADMVTAFQSADGLSWTTVGTVRLSLPSPYYIGWAVSSQNLLATATATFDHMMLSVPSAQNQPPTISLTAPDTSVTYTAPATITISAAAADTDGTISSVDFFEGSTLLGSPSTAPYSFTWSNVPAGSYSFSAVAHDNGGAATTSDTRSVTVNAPANQAPTVSLTAPANGANFMAPASVTVSASASDANGTTTRVDFFAGTTPIGSDTTSPYSVTWNNVAAGSYSLTAVATDNAGATTMSAARTITVTDATSTGTATAPPAGWTAADIGAPAQAGSTQYANGTYTVDGAGEVGGTADQFQFVYRTASGDVDIRARVGSVEAVQAWSKAGVMVRESLAANAAMGMMFISASSGSAFHQRLTTGASRTSTTGTAVAAPYWVRLERRGTTLTASQSADGVAWTAIGTMSVSAADVVVGLAVASGDPTVAATATLDNVTVTTPANPAPTVSLTAPANGAAYKAPASVALSATASDSNGSIARVDFYAGTTLVGSDSASPYSVTWANVAAGTYSLTAVAVDNAGATTTSAARSITVANNQSPTAALTSPANGATFTAPASIAMSATASDADGTIARVDFFAGTTLLGRATAAPYNFTWNNAGAGTYSLTAVARDDNGATTTSAARTVTVNAPANQSPTVSLTAPANGASFTAPASITVSASASDANGTITKVDFFAGTTPIGSDTTSPYSITWNNVAAGSYSLTAVATDNAGAATTSAARTITVTSTAPPAGWTAADIGGPAPGSTQYANGTYTVNGAGEVGGTADQFQFMYRTASGDVDIRAHVGSVEAVLAWSKAGVMVRESLAANAAMGMMFISATSGSAFHQRLTTGADRTSTTGTAVAAPYWVRLERRGTTLTASQSPDGVAWTAIGTMSVSAADVVVGLAVASGDPAQAATATFDNVTVTTPAANQTPAASLTAPANGATFTAPATITVSATASDTDGTIAKVDFFAGTTLIGSDATSPYSITWNSVPAGSYSVTAVATDDDGATRTSASRTITVNGAPNQAPAVSLTAPANGATFTAPASITMTASASDADGTIAKVEFFAGTTLIGSDTTSPYSITWNNVAAGTYSITAVATDNGTAKTTSVARTVTVNAPPPPTSAHAVFTASVDDSMVTRYVLDIFASGADPNTATPIRTQDMGKPPIVNGDCTVDITQTYNALPAGSYISTVSAVGASGSSRSTSTPFAK